MSGSERDRAFLVRQAVDGLVSQRRRRSVSGSAFVSSNGWCAPGDLTVMRVSSRASAADRRTGV
jgi:hypothetical protein